MGPVCRMVCLFTHQSYCFVTEAMWLSVHYNPVSCHVTFVKQKQDYAVHL